MYGYDGEIAGGGGNGGSFRWSITKDYVLHVYLHHYPEWGRSFANEDSSYMFAGFSKITEIEGLENLITHNVTNMSNMFNGCTELTKLDLSQFETEKVTNFSGMFSGCNKLSEVKFGNYYTLNGTANLPAPSNKYIPEADGKWYNTTTLVGYEPSQIPNGVAATYSAIPPITVTFGTNGDSTYAKSHSTTATVSANSTYSSTFGTISALKYMWTDSTTMPDNIATQGTSFSNGATITKNTETGTYYLWIYVESSKGFKYTFRSNEFKLDNTAPTFSVSGNPTNWTNQDVTLTVTMTDSEGSPIHETAYSFDNGTSWQSENTKTFLTNGIVKIKMRDSLGNISTATEVNINNIDNTAPTIAISNISNAGTYTKTKSITITVADTGGSGLSNSNEYKYYLSTSNSTQSGGTWTTYTNGTEFTIGAGLNGTYYLWVNKISDTAGNVSNGNANILYGTALKFDNTAPTVGFTYKTNKDEYLKSQTVEIEISDENAGFDFTNHKGYYKWGSAPTAASNDGEITSERTTVTKSAGTGIEKLYVVVYDKLGNSKSETSADVKLDNTAPTVGFTYKTNKDEYLKSQTVEIEVSDENAGFDFTNHKGYYKWGSAPTAANNDGEIISERTTVTKNTGTGIEKLYVVVYDKLGNSKSETSADIKFDNTEPQVEQLQVGIKKDSPIVIKDGYIENISEKTSISEIINYIITNGTIKIYENGNEVEDFNTYIKTGMVIKISKDSQSVEYTVVIKGDINGDGKITASDLSILKNTIIGNRRLDGAYKRAADVNGDDTIKASDLSKLKKTLVGL